MATFNIISKTSKKKYVVDTITLSCTCPHYLYRLQGTGELCKHIKAVLDNPLEHEQVFNEKVTNLDEALGFIKTDNDSINFIEKFGEDTLNKLLKNGEVIEQHGRLTVI